MKNHDAQKVAYVNHLNPSEKLEAWNYKFDYLLNNVGSLAKSQKEAIISLKNALTEDVFGSTIARDKFMTDFGYSFNEHADKIFSRQQIISYFTSIFINQPSNDIVPDVEDDGGNNCKCSVISDYCPANYYCLDWVCNQSSFGCGFLLLYICDGKCKYNPQ